MDNDKQHKKFYDFNKGEEGKYDVILRVDGQDFYVMRQQLGIYSNVIYDLLCKNPTIDKNEIIELKEISAESLQIFLELINDLNIQGVTMLSGNWRARIPLRKCEEFLLETSNLKKHKKFFLADKFGLEPLKKNLLEQARTSTHLAELTPNGVTSLQRGTLELLQERTREILTISEEEARSQAILAEERTRNLVRIRQQEQQENEILRLQQERSRAHNAAMGLHWPHLMPQGPPIAERMHGMAPPPRQLGPWAPGNGLPIFHQQPRRLPIPQQPLRDHMHPQQGPLPLGNAADHQFQQAARIARVPEPDWGFRMAPGPQQQAQLDRE